MPRGRGVQSAALVAVPLVVYLILVLLGVTNSNIGVSALREDPSDPLGAQIGTSQPIRSDEWGTESPIWLGQLARGGAEDVTPLSVSNDFFAQLPSGPVSAVVFFDGSALALGQWLPQEMLFAAKWWLPTLLLVIGLPLLFRQITGRLRWGYLASALILFAPATAWWSARPVNTLGFVTAGCALAIFGTRRLIGRRWASAAAAFLVGGVLLARTPTYYQPLAIVLAIPVVAATAVFLLRDVGTRRQKLVGLGAIAVSGSLWTALLFAENWGAVSAGLATVYPGERASSGSAVGFGMLFGATDLGWIADWGATLTVNQSEISSAFTVLLPVTVVLLVAARWRGTRPHAAVTVTFLAFGLFWLSWATVDWGSVGTAIPLVNRVPSTRAMLGVGYLAILAFCFFMAQWRPPRRIAVPLVAGGAAALISAYAGSSLQQAEMPDLATWMIWLSAGVTGAVVFLLVRWPGRWWTMSLAALAAFSLVAGATPVIFGLGDLRASQTASEFMTWGAQSRAEGTVWASTSVSVDSLMMATGTPSLSARQQIGPDAEAWEALDPDDEFEDMWNRGGLHITFAWTDGDDVSFSQPVADTVVISASPCTIAERIPSFRYAISAEPLEAGCLSEYDTFTWSGVDYVVYEVSPSTG
ncbi:MAG: hypothetical protein QM604_08485 [Microbacterium sp.]